MLTQLSRIGKKTQFSAIGRWSDDAVERLRSVASPNVEFTEALSNSDTGFYVPYGDAGATAEAIRKALRSDSEMGVRARQRIQDECSLDRRRNRIASDRRN